MFFDSRWETTKVWASRTEAIGHVVVRALLQHREVLKAGAAYDRPAEATRENPSDSVEAAAPQHANAT